MDPVPDRPDEEEVSRTNIGHGEFHDGNIPAIHASRRRVPHLLRPPERHLVAIRVRRVVPPGQSHGLLILHLHVQAVRRHRRIRRQGGNEVPVPHADVDRLPQGSFVLALVRYADNPPLRLDADARQVRLALAGVAHDRPDVRDVIVVAVAERVRPDGGPRRAAVHRVVMGPQPVPDLVSEDRPVVEAGVGGPAVGVLGEALRGFVAKQEVVLAAGASEHPRRVTGEEMHQIGAVFPSQSKRLSVVAELGDDRGAVQTGTVGAHVVQEPADRGHVDDVRSHADAAVSQHHVQVVTCASDCSLCVNALVRPVQLCRARVHDEDVEFFVVLRRYRTRGQIDRHRFGRKPCTLRQTRIESRTHRTERLRLPPGHAEAGGHLTSTVGPRADPVSRAAGLTEPTHQAAALHGQHDAVVASPHQTAGPHQITAAPILEDAESRLQHPAIRSRQFESARFGTQQLQVYLNGDRCNVRREVLIRDGCRLSRPRNQPQQALTLDRRRDENEHRGSQQRGHGATARQTSF